MKKTTVRFKILKPISDNNFLIIFKQYLLYNFMVVELRMQYCREIFEDLFEAPHSQYHPSKMDNP